MKKFILNFYELEEKEKYLKSFLLYFLSGITFLSMGEMPFGNIYTALASINISYIAPFLLSLLIFLPVLFKSKKGYLIYFFIIFLIPNLLWMILLIYVWTTYISIALGVAFGLYIRKVIKVNDI
ncbi:MAG: hypothetical protein ACTHWZ_07210 [Peptoniphilaceae bacterium]